MGGDGKWSPHEEPEALEQEMTPGDAQRINGRTELGPGASLPRPCEVHVKGWPDGRTHAGEEEFMNAKQTTSAWGQPMP